jgi:hypothetical protein
MKIRQGQISSAERLSKQARHDLILRRHTQGWHVTRIAAEVGMSRRGVEGVLERARSTLSNKDPGDELERLLLLIADGYQEDLNDLGDFIAESSSPRQTLSAIKARMEARERCSDLLAEFSFISKRDREPPAGD